MKNSHELRKSVRKNGKQQPTNKHDVNLRKNSVLYFQVGLIVALLLSLFVIEYKTPVTYTEYEEVAIGERIEQEEYVLFTVDQPKPVQPPKPKIVQTTLPPVIDKKDDPEEKEDYFDDIVIDFPTENTGETGAEAVTYVDPEEGVVESHSFIDVQDVPIYPGCEGLDTNEERKECMEEKLNRLIRRKFNTALGDGSPGIKRIDLQFTIDENGNITDVLTRAPDKLLEQEAQRVINMVPTMKPGMQGNKKVRVIYQQPILFKVDR
ncbi:MAG: energy transducer TonB [Leeuwenhoekiella sp.]